MTDRITFTADNYNWILVLNFSGGASATSGTITSVSGSVTTSFADTWSNEAPIAYNGATNTITTSSPYLTSTSPGVGGISFADQYNTDENVFYNSSTGQYELTASFGATFPITNFVFTAGACFAEGTRISTENGWAPVERLAVGDLVRTSAGELRPVKWMGHRAMDFSKSPATSDTLPVRVAAHAFGPDRPSRDLYLSPGHAVCVHMLEEVLVPISSLINGATVQQIDVEAVTYWHVELDSQDILLAENLPAESFLEMGNRGFFVEADCVDLRVAPDGASRGTAGFCRPFYAEGLIVEAARLQLAARAKALGWRIESHADFYLLTDDGRRIAPVVVGRTASFPLARGDLWLVSKTSRPYDIGLNLDKRELGVSISALSYGDGVTFRLEIALDDPQLKVGFGGVEDGAFRWTGARALLPAALFADAPAGCTLLIEMAQDPLPRWIAPEPKTAAKVA